MKNKQGFVELATIQDYCKKLKFDYNQLKADNLNQYKAFNFFITAHHLLDWLFPDKEKNNTIRKRIVDEIIFKVCSHIANGIKHFEVNPKRHSSVNKIEKVGYVQAGYVEAGYVKETIYITLENKAREIFGNTIEIEYLAEEIIEFWKKELNNLGVQTEL
jgi:hypothetical protein